MSVRLLAVGGSYWSEARVRDLQRMCHPPEATTYLTRCIQLERAGAQHIRVAWSHDKLQRCTALRWLKEIMAYCRHAGIPACAGSFMFSYAFPASTYKKHNLLLSSLLSLAKKLSPIIFAHAGNMGAPDP